LIDWPQDPSTQGTGTSSAAVCISCVLLPEYGQQLQGITGTKFEEQGNLVHSCTSLSTRNHSGKWGKSGVAFSPIACSYNTCKH